MVSALGDLKLALEFRKLMIWLFYLVSKLDLWLAPFSTVTTASW